MNKKGFTLPELLIAMAIISIFIILVYSGIQDIKATKELYSIQALYSVGDTCTIKLDSRKGQIIEVICMIDQIGKKKKIAYKVRYIDNNGQYIDKEFSETDLEVYNKTTIN